MSAPPIDVVVLVGSLRKASLTRITAKSLIALAPSSLRCEIEEIGDLPLYNEDLETDVPESWRRFRARIKACDAILFATPEYNRSIPGCLKNALDVGSRPKGANVFDRLPAGIVSVTPFKLGAFGANHALRQCFVFLNMPAMQQPEAYIGDAANLFDERGTLKVESTRQFLTTFMTSLAKWFETNPRSPR
jgi:NAD(P)H-dependent FMN reductase